MFLKSNHGEYYNIKAINFIWVNKDCNGDGFVIEAEINGEMYTLQTYQTEQMARYALDFIFRLINQTKGKHAYYRMPDENTSKLYQWADSIDEKEGAAI